MHSRREDSRLRVPSPAPTRRNLRPRDAYSDDHYFDARSRTRDPSPGGFGRLSSSAPPGGEMSSFYWKRYPDHRYSDNYSQVTSVSSHASSRTRETSPRTNRMTSSTHSYVNGDAALHPSRSRPKSFPEQRGTYLSENSSHQGYVYYRQRSRDPSPSYGGGRVQGHDDEASPNSDEALSSVTLTTERVASHGDGTEVLEGSFTCDDGYTWHSALTCYLCGQLFRRPRILPCGHTFCSECLAQLKDESLREGRRIPGGPSACSTDCRHRTDVGAQFVCPMPECRYSMRLMNLSRWSTRNKAVTDAVSTLRRIFENRQDASTQTDITMESLLVTIPRSLIQETPPPVGERGLMRRNSGSLVDRMVHRAISMDSLSRSYIPQQHGTWRSYVAMLGMHILQQTTELTKTTTVEADKTTPASTDNTNSGMQETGPRGDTQYTGDTENMEVRNTVITRSTQVKKDDSEQNDQAVRMSLRSNPAQNMSPSPVGNSTTSFAGDTTIGSAANNAVKNRAKESSSDASASETADEGPMESGEPHEGNENDQQSLGQKAADTCHKGAGVDTQSSLRLRPDQRENSEDENSLACQTPRLEQDNNPEEAWDVNGTIAESRTQTNITNTDSVIAEPGKDAMVTNTASSNEIADSCTETANHAEDVPMGILFKQEEEATDIEENKEALSVSERNEKTANKNGQTDMIPRAPPVKPEIITVRLQQSPHVQAGSLSVRENRAKATEITQLQDRTYKENNVQVNAVQYKEQQTSEIATAENETTAESFQLDTQPDSPGSSTKEDTNSRLYFVVDNGEGGYKVFQADGTEVTEPEMVAGGDAGTNSVVHLSVTDLQVPEDKEASEVKVETGVKGTQPYQIDPSLIPIKAIPAMSMLQPPQARGGDPDKAETFPYMPPDPTFMYMPEEGVMKSQPVPKPTRGRRGRRKSPTNLTPGLRLPVPCGLPLTQYPRQRVKRTYRRYNLPTSTALPSQYYTGVNSGGETDSQPPDAAGDMLGYKDVGGVSPRYGNTGWYWGDEYYAPQHQWYADRGRGRGRGRSRRGSGGVRQYLQHRLLWARYTGRSQEALDRVLTIINSKCSLKGEESKPVVGGKTWSREGAPEATDRQVLNDQRLDTATSSELQNPYDVYHGRNFSSNISNMMAGGTNSSGYLSQSGIGSNAVVDGNGYIVYLNQEDSNEYPSHTIPFIPNETTNTNSGGGDTAKMSNAAEVAREGSARLDSGYCQQSDKTKNIRNTPPRRLKTPVSPVKEQKAGKRQHSGGGNRKKRVRRSLTFSSPIKQEETLTATESLANVMKDSNDTEREDPSPAPTPTPLPSISSLLQSSNNTGISINIHLTNNDNSDRTSRTGGEETAAERSRSTVEHTASDCATRGDIGSRHVKGNTLHYPVPRYTVEWRGNYQDSGASDWFHPYQPAPPNIGSSYRNPYREPGGYYMMDRPFHPMDCYYTADYTKDWAGAYSKYPPNHFLPKYEPPQVAVSSAYPGWGRHSDVYADAHHDGFVARTTQASDTPYSYYHRAAPYQGKPGFADEAFLQSRDAAAIGERHSMQRLASNADSTSSYRLADRHEAVYGMHSSSDVHESAQEQQDMEGNVQNMSPQREPSVNLDSSLEGQRGDLQDQETVNQ